MTDTGIYPEHGKRAAAGRQRTAASWVTAAAAFAALILAGAALAVSLTHAGPRGAAGAAGLTGPAGPAGPAGLDAPTLSYQCQMLMPKNGGTETTFYWPCTPNGG